jgi:thiosulfate dehydrogenase [quinone] large subunit
MNGTVSTVDATNSRASSGIEGVTLAANKFSNTNVAYALLRLCFGANIMLHGLSRVLNGRAVFLAYLGHYFEHAHLVPAAILPAFSAVLPWAETTVGLLVFLGLASRFAFIAGALVMLVLVIGTNLAQDWPVAGLQLIYCFIYYYLLAHLEQNALSVDGLIS